MERLFVLLFVLFAIPATFFAGAAWAHYRARQHASYELNAQLGDLQQGQESIYGPNNFHWKYNDRSKTLIEGYDPATMGGSIRVSYIGGFRDVFETYFELQGSGELYSGVDGNRKLVTTIEADPENRARG